MSAKKIEPLFQITTHLQVRTIGRKGGGRAVLFWTAKNGKKYIEMTPALAEEIKSTLPTRARIKNKPIEIIEFEGETQGEIYKIDGFGDPFPEYDSENEIKDWKVRLYLLED